MNELTIKQAQQDVDNWIKTVGVKYFGELTNMAILTEEVGEVARAALEHDTDGLRLELVQVAAVAVAWLEAL